MVRVRSRQENGATAARARRWVHEGAVGENVAHAGALVDANEGGLRSGRVGLDHRHGDDGDAEVGEQARGEGLGRRGFADDARQLGVAQDPADDLGVRGSVAGLKEGEEQVAAALDIDHRGREDRVNDGHERVIRQLGHEERDEVGLAAAQRPSGRVGDVVEFACGLLDAIDGGGRDLHVPASSVEDERNGRRCDACRAGDVGPGCALHAAAPNSRLRFVETQQL